MGASLDLLRHVSVRVNPFFAAGAQCRRLVFTPSARFRYRSRIRVGRRTRFQRGALVYSDRHGFIEIGAHCVICSYAILQSVGGRIQIGDRCLIGDFSNLYGHTGGLVIGNDVMLASGVRLVPEAHTFDTPGLAVKDQPTSSRGVRIGDGAWLATNVVVLDGVEVGRGAVVGAGAVVNRSIPDFAIAAGVPARVVRMRHGHESAAEAAEVS